MKTDGLKCNRCGHPLEVVEHTEDWNEDYGDSTTLKCPNCGAMFECVEPADKDKGDFDFYKDGEPTEGRLDEPDIYNEHCINCGHKVSMSNNFMLSDYDDSIGDDPDKDKMNFVLNQCPYCGMNETRWDTAEDEKPGLPYWEEDNEFKEKLLGYSLYYIVHFWAKVNGLTPAYPYVSQRVADELRRLADTYDEKKDCK